MRVGDKDMGKDMNEFLEPFQRLLEQLFTPETVRAVEQGGPVDPLWQDISSSGFLDALVPEQQGGAGLTLADVQPLWQALGYHASPLPVGETMIARALLAAASAAIPDGPIALATGARGRAVPYARIVQHVLMELDGQLVLESATYDDIGVPGSLAAVRLQPIGAQAGYGSAEMIGTADQGALHHLSATLRASLIAGAGQRLTEMTAAYANERVQFGKPIGRQQALQQNMAVMAEDMVASRMAAELACAGAMPPTLAAAATAKSITSRAAARIAATAHAVHGAIGISEQYDLQLFTRRLHEWRLADGSESYWNRLLGQQRLKSSSGSVDFVRKSLPF